MKVPIQEKIIVTSTRRVINSRSNKVYFEVIVKSNKKKGYNIRIELDKTKLTKEKSITKEYRKELNTIIDEKLVIIQETLNKKYNKRMLEYNKQAQS